MQRLEASHFPAVGELLAARPGAATRIFAVLHEDTYETLFGDGEYHYLWNVFLSAEEAQFDVARNRDARARALAAGQRDWSTSHTRSFGVRLDGRDLVSDDFVVERCDRHTFEGALHALEERLALGYLKSSSQLVTNVAWDAKWLVTFGVVSHYFCYDDAAVDRVLGREPGEARICPVGEIARGEAPPGLTRDKWRMQKEASAGPAL